MPNTLIETRKGWITDPAAVIDAVQSAMVSGFQIPPNDRTVRLIEHAPSHFAVPPEVGERYTIVESKVVSGRSIELKRAVYKAIADNLEKLGVPRNEIKVSLIEVPADNWGVRGGMALSDLMAQSKKA